MADEVIVANDREYIKKYYIYKAKLLFLMFYCVSF